MGAIQTLTEMRRLTIEAIQSQKPRQIALEQMHYSYAANTRALVQALFNWLLVRVTIIDEYEELLISPLIMISEIEKNGRTGGDCDDVAMLSASLLGSVGAAVRFRAVQELDDGSFAHVFTEYKFPRDKDFSIFDLTIGYNQIRIDYGSITMDVIS
jgi:hypothetical protein